MLTVLRKTKHCLKELIVIQSEMICGDAILNVETGSISNGNQLDSLVISQNGKMIRRFDYDNKGQVFIN